MRNEERRNILLDIESEDKENHNEKYSIAENNLQRRGDIECYDKIMEPHPNYSSIVYTKIRKFKERIRNILSTKFKLFRNTNSIMIFVILL
jgi:hypothetical protein